MQLKDAKSSVMGNLVAIHERRLVIEMNDGGQVGVPRAKIKRMYRSVGTQTSGKKGALFGVATGMVLGVILLKKGDDAACGVVALVELPSVLITGSEFSDCKTPLPELVAKGAMVGAIFPGIPLAGLGWLIGKKIKTDKWELVKLDEQAQAQIAPMFRLTARQGSQQVYANEPPLRPECRAPSPQDPSDHARGSRGPEFGDLDWLRKLGSGLAHQRTERRRFSDVAAG